MPARTVLSGTRPKKHRAGYPEKSGFFRKQFINKTIKKKN